MFITRKRIRKDIQGSKLFSPYYPPKRCQAYFDALLWCYYNENGTKQWNFTINPDPSKCPNKDYNSKTFGRMTDKQVFGNFKRNIKNDIVLNKKLMPFIREYLIFSEYGDKNGKPHCNLVLLMEPETPDKIIFYIKNRLMIYGTSHHTIDFKNQKQTFKKPDIYNQKDAGFMSTLGFKPVYGINKHSISRQNLLNQVKNSRIEYSYYPYTVCDKNRSPGTGHYFVNSKSQYVIIGIKKNI